MHQLVYVPVSEFRRLRTADLAPVAKAEAFAALCRLNTLYMIMRAGSGHIGSSFSAMDIVSWLYLNEISPPADEGPEQTVYFSSKGHDAPGLYSALIGLEYLDFQLLHGLRRLDGLPGHPDVGTPCILTNTGSLGMGISKAKGIEHARRLDRAAAGTTYVLTGDGELQEGQFWESLQSAANEGMGGIVAVVDHNKIQSDTWVSAVSDLGDLEAKFRAFGWEVARCDGHDIGALAAVLAGFKEITDRPKVLIADTIKGRGVSFMEHTRLVPPDIWYRFHSGAPDAESYARAAAELFEGARARFAACGLGEPAIERVSIPPRTAPAGEQRLVAAYSRALLEQAGRNEAIVALDADLVLDCGLIPFRERFPDRFVECGIAEQDMVSRAGALALRGKLPVAHSFACFLSTRPNEQIYNNASEHTRVMYVGALAGLLPSGPGHSHQSVRDIAILASVPGLELIEPSCEQEVELAVDYCLNRCAGSSYLRLVSIPCAVPYRLPAGYTLETGVGAILRDGDDAVVFAYGPVMLPQVCRAAELLAERDGLAVRVVNLPWLNRLDDDWLVRTVSGVRAVFTVDNHYREGGQGDMVLARLAELGLAAGVRCRKFGVVGIPKCGQNDEVLRAHGLDADSLAQAMAGALRG